MSELVLSRTGLSHAAESHWCIAPPLGLGYLAAVARQRGIDVRIVDGRLERHLTVRQTVEAIAAHRPEMVGLSSLTSDFRRAAEIARQLKDTSRPPLLVLGGAHANALPRESLNDASGFDYVVAGEAESALSDLFHAVRAGTSTSAVPGVYAKDHGGEPGTAHQAKWEHDLAEMPFPAWELFPRVKIYPLLSERGCPYHCVFCSHNLLGKVRSRPVEHVMEEIRWLHADFSPDWIYFEDETFGINCARTEELLNALIDFNRRAGIKFKAQTRVDRVNRNMLQLMKAARFAYLELGVESGDSEVLSRSEKGINLEQVENAVRMAKEEGMKVWLKFIIGLPGESERTIRRSIELAVRLNPDRLSVAIIVAYPGSRVFDWARSGENGYRLLSHDWSRFDKYLSSSVELKTLPYHVMRRWQVRMYLEVYLRNWRLVELLSMLWENRSIVFCIARDCLRFGRKR